MFISNGKGLIVASVIMLLQGLFFTALGAFFALPTWEAVYVQKTGTPGQGTVVEVYDSNTQVNGIYLKNVAIEFKGEQQTTESVPDRVSFGLSVGDVVPIRLQGDRFVMEYPASFGFLVLMSLFPAIGLILFFVGLFLFSRYRKNKERHAHLSLYGQSARGRILSIGFGSLKVNQTRYQKVELEFLGQKHVIKNIHPEKIRGLMVGDEIELKYDSQNQEDFVVVDGRIQK